jgi:hypothetical protein
MKAYAQISPVPAFDAGPPGTSERLYSRRDEVGFLESWPTKSDRAIHPDRAR